MKLDAEKIEAELPDFNVNVFDVISSTNTIAKQQIQQASDKQQLVPGLVVANVQTAGYGRQDRAFYSPADVGIYMTVMTQVTTQQWQHPETLTLNTAVAIQKVIQSELGISLGIKWVNDLYLHERKVVGILVETVQPPTNGHPGFVVIGMGINLQARDIPAQLQTKMGGLTTDSVDRERLISQLSQACLAAIQMDFSQLRQQYLQNCFILQEEVTLQHGHDSIIGKVVDVDDYGRIVLATQYGRQAYNAGEITKVNLS
ncbi:biotin--[acetyl-CoA-carboxylase] ligase [Weissella viridescens]|uniref:biotin--[acetyl-CoA-carboxylase] ligase n=1 Tax=Weissella viridescens TaxID=1629 RepID=UPI001C7D7A1E|nr:biotin--[acetyl-CoA-carboxylase] ligase [Weissella viridescens]MBX4173277.1 biotin--[acetyl-CoA-carboxylase] ligase [Weissella viridescens]